MAWAQSEKDALVDLISRGGGATEAIALFPGRNAESVGRQYRRLVAKSKKGVVLPVGQRVQAQIADEIEREYTGDSLKIKGTAQREITSLKEFVEYFEVDTDDWEIVSWSAKSKTWNAYIKNAKNQIETKQLHGSMVSATMRMRAGLKAKAEAEFFRDAVAEYVPIPPPVLKVVSADDYGRGKMLEIALPDAHFGKLAWHSECGDSYDTDIARKLYIRAIDEILGRFPNVVFERICYVVGNDLINTDNPNNTTTRGTAQDVDTRHAKVFRAAWQTVRDVIESRLRPRALEVHVEVVPGNHDQDSAYKLGEVLSAWFHTYLDVKIHNAPTLRKVHVFGKCAVGLVHGSEEKQSDLPLIMTQEFKPELADVDHFEIHLGHLHQRRAVQVVALAETLGIVVRVLSSICPADAYRASKGYILNKRVAEAFVWDKVEGVVRYEAWTAPKDITQQLMVAA